MVIQPPMKKRRGRPPGSGKAKKHQIAQGIFDTGENVGNDDLGPMPEPVPDVEVEPVADTEAEPSAADLAVEPEVAETAADTAADRAAGNGESKTRTAYDGDAAITCISAKSARSNSSRWTRNSPSPPRSSSATPKPART